MRRSSVAARFAGMRAAADGTAEAVYRQYQSSVGRWLSEDPSGFVDGPNLYAYVVNSPVAQTDQLGLQSLRGLLPACIDRILADGNQVSQAGNPRRAHCITTCRLTRECDSNPLAAVTAGFWKEVADTASCFAGRNQRSCDTAFQPSDFKDNFRGAMCWLKPESCYTYCERTTPEGDGRRDHYPAWDADDESCIAAPQYSICDGRRWLSAPSAQRRLPESCYERN